MEEFEIIPHRLADGVRIFINRVEYRSPHFHPEWELLWVLDTPLSIVSGHRQRLIRPGELILFPPNYPHEFHIMDRPCTFLCIQISSRATMTENLRTEDIHLAGYLPQEDDLWVRRAILDAAEAFWRQGEFSPLFYQSLCGLVLHRLLTRLPHYAMSLEELTDTQQRNERLRRLLQFVDENYMHKLRLSDFARQEGKSLSYMSHFVRDTMNQTFQDYVSSVRFNRARQMILEGRETLVGISVAAGFSDYRYFSRAFTRAYGMTPAEYRRQAQDLPPELLPPGSSLHSREEILTPEQSLAMLQRFRGGL